MARDVLAFSPALRLSLYRITVWLCERLPLWSLRACGYALGCLGWWFDARGRATVLRNVAPFVPRACPEARRRSARRQFTSFGMMVFESFAMGQMPRTRFLPPWLTVVDPYGVFRQRPRVETTIFTTVHCNWELATAMYHHLNLIHECSVVTLSHGDDKLNRLFAAQRARFGCHTLFIDSAPLGVLRSLKRGRHLCMVSDRDYAGTGVPVRFGGRHVRLPFGPAALAVQSGAPLVPCLLARRSAERFVLILDRPIHADLRRPKGEEIARLTQYLADRYTRFITAAPGQWVAFHDAFKQKH